MADGGSLLEESLDIGGGHGRGHVGIRGIDLKRGARSLRGSAGSRSSLVLGDLEERHGSSFGSGAEELDEGVDVCCDEGVGCAFAC